MLYIFIYFFFYDIIIKNIKGKKGKKGNGWANLFDL